MKIWFIKISSILLALLVLFSTLSFTVEKHYCGDYLVSVSYFGNGEDCSGEVGEEDCDDPEVIKKKELL